MNPLDPAYMKGFNDGQKEAVTKFHDFLTERMESLITVDGIGKKTVEKVHFHLIERLREK